MFELVEADNIEDVANSLLVKSDGKPTTQSRAPAVIDNSDDGLTAEPNDKSAVESDNVDGLSVKLLEDDTPVDDDDTPGNDLVISDDTEFELIIDGKPVVATLKEMKSRYSGAIAIDQRLQEATEVKRQLESAAQYLHASLNAQKTRLAQIDAVLKQITEPAINWEELRTKDPARYLLERDRVREAQERRELVAKEADRVEREQAELQAQALEMYADDQAKALAEKLPELRDEAKGKIITDGFAKAGKYYGFTPTEIQKVMDHRALLVLNDARKYLDLVEKANKLKTKAKPAQVKTLLRPGTGSSAQPGTRISKQYQERVARARQTGDVNDVALTLLVPKKANGR